MDRNTSLVVSYIRIMATLMVVGYHCLCFYTDRWTFGSCNIPVYEWLASTLNFIDMPAFVFISGFIYGTYLRQGRYTSDIAFVKKKALRLLVPYCFWGMVILLLTPDLLSLKDGLLNGVSHLWFLLMLFVIFIIATLTKGVWHQLSVKTSFALLFLLLLPGNMLYYKGITFEYNILQYKSVLTYIPAFYLGIITSDIKTTIRTIPFFQMLCVVSISSYIYFSLITTHNPAIKSFLLQVTAYTTIVTAFVLIKNCSLKTNVMLMMIDKYSFDIYILHHILITYFIRSQELQTFMAEHWLLSPIALFFVSIIISIALANILRRLPLVRHTL